MKQQIKLPKIREKIKEDDTINRKHMIGLIIITAICFVGIPLVMYFGAYIDINPVATLFIISGVCTIILLWMSL